MSRYSGADCFVVNGNITTPFKPLNGSSLSLYIYMYLFNCYVMATPRLRRCTSPYSIAFTFTSTTADVYEPPADVRATCCSLAFIARAHALVFRHRRSWFPERVAILLLLYWIPIALPSLVVQSQRWRSTKTNNMTLSCHLSLVHRHVHNNRDIYSLSDIIIVIVRVIRGNGNDNSTVIRKLWYS